MLARLDTKIHAKAESGELQFLRTKQTILRAAGIISARFSDMNWLPSRIMQTKMSPYGFAR
jgi:hypothetical protein